MRSRDVVGPTRPGRRIVYCTDTRPCDAAVTLAANADILIHEATYTDDMITEAHDRWHTTARAAAAIAGRANVRRLILTHISGRYHDTDAHLAEARDVFAETVVARDFYEADVARP